MKSRTFNAIMPQVNEEWAANVLRMQRNQGRGPDILGDNKVLEVKFCLINPKKVSQKSRRSNYPTAWTVQDHQLEYAELYNPIFWGLGFYELTCPIREIRTYNQEELEKLVTAREIYIVEWQWMNQFEMHKVNGKTKFSQWKNFFRYPKKSSLPKITRSYEVEKGLVHLTKGVPAYLFDLK